MENFKIKLSRVPTVRLDCTLIASTTSASPRDTLIVFVSGFDNPRSIWLPTVSEVLKKRTNTPPMLLYNRPGQEKGNDRNRDGPDMPPGRPKGHSRDCLDAAHDLREVIVQTTQAKLSFQKAPLRIVFVASSIGVAIVRLYDIHYPGTISGFIILDTTIANRDVLNIFPDPDAPGFSEKTLPDGMTTEELRDSRARMKMVYHINAPNREGLWRGNLPELLPESDAPLIKGSRPGLPYLTVLEHDREVSQVESEKVLGQNRGMTRYFDAHWHEYNQGIARLTGGISVKGVMEAKGCGHLIQKYKPELVADEISEMLDKVAQHEPSRL